MLAAISHTGRLHMTFVAILALLLVIWILGWAIFVNAPDGTSVLNFLFTALLLAVVITAGVALVVR